MVAPVRDFGNKFIFFSLNTHSQQDFQLPTVFPSNHIGMDILAGYSPDNYDKMRGRTGSLKLQVSCYDLKSLGLDKRTTLVLSNIRELNRDSFTK